LSFGFQNGAFKTVLKSRQIIMLCLIFSAFVLPSFAQGETANITLKGSDSLTDESPKWSTFGDIAKNNPSDPNLDLLQWSLKVKERVSLALRRQRNWSPSVTNCRCAFLVKRRRFIIDPLIYSADNKASEDLALQIISSINPLPKAPKSLRNHRVELWLDYPGRDLYVDLSNNDTKYFEDLKNNTGSMLQ